MKVCCVCENVLCSESVRVGGVHVCESVLCSGSVGVGGVRVCESVVYMWVVCG